MSEGRDSSLRSAAPPWVKASGRAVAHTIGRYTSNGRLVPSFLVIGGQRCGTTSLHRALIAHPVVAGPILHKGVNYFDLNYHRGPAWYRAHFPLLSTARRRAGNWSVGSGEPQAMESCGYYLYHPLALPRIARDLPGVRLIIMIRDPVERAYSAHKHEVARGFETESFERALELEEERLAGEEERLASDPHYQSHSHRHHAYLARGRYVEQLERVFGLFSRENVLIIESENFFANPAEVYDQVLDFLGLPSWVPSSFGRYNARPSAPMPESLRKQLDEYFLPYDEKLAKLLGHTPAWRR
ncbi:MAG TPA: sulfotransferase [Actinopolymorphaceae bacterium]